MKRASNLERSQRGHIGSGGKDHRKKHILGRDQQGLVPGREVITHQAALDFYQFAIVGAAKSFLRRDSGREQSLSQRTRFKDRVKQRGTVSAERHKARHIDNLAHLKRRSLLRLGAQRLRLILEAEHLPRPLQRYRSTQVHHVEKAGPWLEAREAADGPQGKFEGVAATRLLDGDRCRVRKHQAESSQLTVMVEKGRRHSPEPHAGIDQMHIVGAAVLHRHGTDGSVLHRNFQNYIGLRLEDGLYDTFDFNQLRVFDAGKQVSQGDPLGREVLMRYSDNTNLRFGN